MVTVTVPPLYEPTQTHPEVPKVLSASQSTSMPIPIVGQEGRASPAPLCDEGAEARREEAVAEAVLSPVPGPSGVGGRPPLSLLGSPWEGGLGTCRAKPF